MSELDIPLSTFTKEYCDYCIEFGCVRWDASRGSFVCYFTLRNPLDRFMLDDNAGRRQYLIQNGYSLRHPPDGETLIAESKQSKAEYAKEQEINKARTIAANAKVWTFESRRESWLKELYYYQWLECQETIQLSSRPLPGGLCYEEIPFESDLKDGLIDHMEIRIHDNGYHRYARCYYVLTNDPNVYETLPKLKSWYWKNDVGFVRRKGDATELWDATFDSVIDHGLIRCTKRI